MKNPPLRLLQQYAESINSKFNVPCSIDVSAWAHSDGTKKLQFSIWVQIASDPILKHFDSWLECEEFINSLLMGVDYYA